jgi:hypothetical protein
MELYIPLFVSTQYSLLRLERLEKDLTKMGVDPALFAEALKRAAARA